MLDQHSHSQSVCGISGKTTWGKPDFRNHSPDRKNSLHSIDPIFGRFTSPTAVELAPDQQIPKSTWVICLHLCCDSFFYLYRFGLRFSLAIHPGSHIDQKVYPDRVHCGRNLITTGSHLVNFLSQETWQTLEKTPSFSLRCRCVGRCPLHPGC